MSILHGNAVVGQSGGPTAAINATLSGVIRGALKHKEQIPVIYGMKNGIEGLLREDLIELNGYFAREEDLTLLEDTPAAALGSCRYRLPDPAKETEVFDKILAIFRKYDIRYFFYIGGNDSMDAVAKLSAYLQKVDYEMRVIGVPKTIDNDLLGTDHTPGFGSAAKYIATTVSEIVRDCAVYTVRAVTIVEIMGRDAGWLTAASALPTLSGEGPDLIYLPERVFDMETFLSSVRAALEKHPNVVIAVSEGLRDKDGKYVGETAQSGVADAFGHKYLAGTGKALEIAVKAALGCKVRSVELNLPQRCAAHLSSATDIAEAIRTGIAATDAAVAGKSGHMMGLRRLPGETYATEIVSSAVSEIANKVKTVPDEYITASGDGITQAGIDYLTPLILGERTPRFVMGMPAHFRF